MYAFIHSSHTVSTHMGSSVGVPGVSGKQDQPLLPSRSTTKLPSASISQSRIVASVAMDDGPALIAFAIFASASASLWLATGAARARPTARVPVPNTNSSATWSVLFRSIIGASFHVWTACLVEEMVGSRTEETVC